MNEALDRSLDLGASPRPNGRAQTARVEVVAAVLELRDGRFLLAQRPKGKVYEGYWEFPGGKIEPGESPARALARELHEELGIEVRQCYPWLTRDYDYEHAAVRLRFFRVTEWSGELHGKEDQALAWQRIGRITAAPVLPANGPIMRALALPHIYGISNAGQVGADAFLDGLRVALARGLRLVQIREKSSGEDAVKHLALRARVETACHGAKILVNGTPELASRAGADGVHLSARVLSETSARPDLELVGASCHDERELERAVRVGVDFVVLGPVTETASHPGAATLGWKRFSELAQDYPLPIYAVGGLGSADLEAAWRAGAHGVAAIRAAWSR